MTHVDQPAAAAAATAAAPESPPPNDQPAAEPRRRGRVLRAAGGAWLDTVRAPLSLAELWELCSIPGARGLARVRRVALFTVLAACPAGLAAPLLLAASHTKPATQTDAAAEPGRFRKLRNSAVAAALTWLGFDRAPQTVREAWRRSAFIDVDRIPAESNLLAFFWYWSNYSDRLALFALIPLCPVGLLAPLVYIAERPTRRYGFFLILLVVAKLAPSLATS